MESWKQVWRDGIAPILPTAGLERLADYLERDDGRLVQGRTYSPDIGVHDYPCAGGCALAVAGSATMPATCGEAMAAFSNAIEKAGGWCHNSAYARPFLKWFDATDRDTMRRELLPEVRRELERRATATVAA